MWKVRPINYGTGKILPEGKNAKMGNQKEKNFS